MIRVSQSRSALSKPIAAPVRFFEDQPFIVLKNHSTSSLLRFAERSKNYVSVKTRVTAFHLPLMHHFQFHLSNSEFQEQSDLNSRIPIHLFIAIITPFSRMPVSSRRPSKLSVPLLSSAYYSLSNIS